VAPSKPLRSSARLKQHDTKKQTESGLNQRQRLIDANCGAKDLGTAKTGKGNQNAAGPVGQEKD
jgi:hypothetical protein